MGCTVYGVKARLSFVANCTVTVALTQKARAQSPDINAWQHGGKKPANSSPFSVNGSDLSEGEHRTLE